MTTPYHAKYFAHDLTRHARSGDADCLSMALFDACVDLNPHQIEAAMFALRSPLSQGVLLADEVGLGKTIEAGLVLCQYWAERKRKLIVICPASLRKQWSLELLEKFNLPSIILDSKSYRQTQKDGDQTPFSTDKVVITSYNYASRMRGDLRAVPFDVVVINFLNERNEADRRAHELLSEKFNLFEGVSGASDEVLGQIESGIDFEKRILAIYQQCRTTEQIDEAFQLLQAEMDEKIQSKMDDTRRQLIEHFDEDVHAKLKMRLDDTRANLDRISRQFWALSRFVLRDHAAFCEDSLSFELSDSPIKSCEAGRYHLISKDGKNRNGNFHYRLSHPLGEWSIDQGKQQSTPAAKVTFDITGYSARVALVEALKGKQGWLTLQHLTVDSFGREEHLLFSATDAGGKSLDQETCQKLFNGSFQFSVFSGERVCTSHLRI